MEIIESRENPRIKKALKARDGNLREYIFVEGVRLAEDFAASSLSAIEVFHTQKLESNERGAKLLRELTEKSLRVSLISEKIADVLGETVAPQGIFIVAEKPLNDSENFAKTLPKPARDKLFTVVLHEINNPSNIGAILRTANAAGAHGAILTKKSADVFAPKSLRASMGAAFRMNLWTNADFYEAVEWCRTNDLQTVGASVAAEQNHVQIDWRKSSAIFLGSEAHGFQMAELEHFDTDFRIPMQAKVESLNVAASAAVVFYEVARQRGFRF